MVKSSFFEFNVAKSALFTAQANLQVTSHNIANAATTGYSRQYGVTTTNAAMSGNGTGMYGTGSSVTTVARYRSQFLDQKYWSQNSTYSQYASQTSILQSIETTFTTVDSDGIESSLLTYLNDLESVFSDLATNANDLTFRNNVLSSAEALAQMVAQIGNSLTQQQQQVNEEIVITVNQMNSIADQIARLNTQIQQFEYRGDTANDLRDQRELLLDELSSYVNIEVQENDNNELIVFIDGTQFIKGSQVNTLELVNRDDQDPVVQTNPYDAPGMYDIYFAGSNTKFPMYSSSLEGSLKGLIDIRDGNNARGLTLEQGEDENGIYGVNEYGDEFYRTTSFKGIPHYIDRVNELVRVLAKAINEGVDYEGNAIEGATGHVYGYDLDDNTGRFFFSLYDDEGNEITNTSQEVTLYDENGDLITKADGTLPTYNDLTDEQKDQLYSNIDWNSFTVSTELQSDPSLIATSSVIGAGESNNAVSLGISSLMDDVNLFASGKMNDFVIGITSEIAVSSKQASSFEARYADLLNVSDNQRISYSGVDLNEESVNMVKYQQMYQAASKLITVIDSIYDTTINQLI